LEHRLLEEIPVLLRKGGRVTAGVGSAVPPRRMATTRLRLRLRLRLSVNLCGRRALATCSRVRTWRVLRGAVGTFYKAFVPSARMERAQCAIHLIAIHTSILIRDVGLGQFFSRINAAPLLNRATVQRILHRGYLALTIVGLVSTVSVYALHDWFHGTFLQALGVSAALGDAIGGLLIILIALLGTRVAAYTMLNKTLDGKLDLDQEPNLICLIDWHWTGILHSGACAR